MVFRRIVTVAVIGVAAASLRKPPAQYSEDALEIKKMMDGVREQTEGAPVHKAPVVKASKTIDRFAESDKQLMHKADLITEEVYQFDHPVQKKVSAISTKVSRKDAAARFFATHGMKDVGAMLGDKLSADAEQQALQDAQAAKEAIEADVATPVSHLKHSQAVDTSDSMDFDDDDQDAKYKEQ